MNDSLVQLGAPTRPRLPEWARKSKTHFESLNHLKRGLRELKLHTVCEEAKCPNMGECWEHGAATFMLMGDVCTRHCGFCAVSQGAAKPLEAVHAAIRARVPAMMVDRPLSPDIAAIRAMIVFPSGEAMVSFTRPVQSI